MKATEIKKDIENDKEKIEKIEKIVDSLVGLKSYEWQAIKRVVDMEFAVMSNRLELIDMTRIKKNIENEIIH